MRIPRSVIVMSLVTAVPFGLGIRDTLAKKDVDAGDEYGGLDFGDRRSAKERQRALEEYEAELEREAADRAAREKERLAKLDHVFGPKVASMGSLLDGIAIGADAGTFQPEHVRQRVERESRDGLFHVSFDVDASSLNAVNVRVTGDYEAGDACELLDEKLEAAWGPSANGTWVDPATHQRATFDEDTCTLTFDRYLAATEWAAQLPLAAIGSNAEKFAEQLGPAAEVDDDRASWRIAGLAFGKGATRLEAYLENNRVVGFKATVATDFDSTVAVRETLATTLKAQPKLDEETRVWTWKRKVPVTLEQISNELTVLVGKTPWD